MEIFYLLSLEVLELFFFLFKLKEITHFIIMEKVAGNI